jgi:hypothetical protein
MLKKSLTLCCCATALAMLSYQVAAHHSVAVYDRSKEVTLTGTVKSFQYTNPHSWLIVEVLEKNGKVTTWGFESEGPSSLMRAGIRKSDLAPGTKIVVVGHPMKDGRPAGTFVKATRLSDGKVFDPHKVDQ